MSDHFDIAIIGAGPGGYVCAIRAAHNGLKVAVIDERPAFGGTCLNVGCIPSKALLHVSERFHEAAHDFAAMGIACEPRIDIAAMQAFKDKVVEANTKGIAYLFRKNGVTGYHGKGRVSAPGTVEVTADDGAVTTLKARHIVIATGAEPATLKGVKIDEKTILSSTGALALDEAPKHLAVIGAGVIGLELGSVWRRLGADVTVIEYLDRILPGMDAELAKTLHRELKKQGLAFRLASRVEKAAAKGRKATLTVSPAGGGEKETIEAEKVLVAIGRVPRTRGLGLADIGIATDEKGRIVVNERFETNIAGIYAIGDVIPGPMLAHKASEDGVALADLLAGKVATIDHELIPAVVYTAPEAAAVGRTEEELKAAGVEYARGSFAFLANGRARAMNLSAGFVKLLADARSDRLLGAHVLGPMAGELIHEIAALMAFGGAAEDLARITHAHPTLSEALREAALAISAKAIHS
ncbi:MAG TPA: dihydrolipoyl dehydrogenase [Thermopetrobacter sp.]|nr:dihydrolipoyl dehydrogenase [Thermopetrobacter sp.]